ncbi:5'-nucleotidase C-terminal domain-containing protein [Paenibacillus turpanensis]|uniref:5'-nucleotidase C-terminal domain-containing protein n=1 Tax=Paenibacillus turpanensis TaxID=2689078 RepID=UPI00140C4FCE|nr:5'-nucleotidase C-terminal domain-containing protein [Paenibacillus turpanensis]
MNRLTKRYAAAMVLAISLVTVPLAGQVKAVESPAAAGASNADGQRVSILYFNDGHEIAPVTDKLGTRGGAARIKTLVDSVQDEKIVAFGGDLGGGTLFGGVFKGFPMVEAFHHIPVDVANFGQHDFDAGVDNALDLIQASRFQWISSNLVGSDGKPFGQVPDHVVIEKQGIRVGIIGLTSAMETTVRDERVKQLPVIEAAKQAVQKLESQQPDVIIALTQEPSAKDKALLAAVPEIHAVFTEEEAEEQSFVHEVDQGRRFVFSPQGNMGSIIRLIVEKDAAGGIRLSHDILKADETVAEDPALAKLAAEYQAKLDQELGKTVATMKQELLYGENHESRFKETAIGNWIADAYRDYYGTDLAFANGGGIRASAKQGEFTLKDAKAILPFGNKIVVAEVDGEMVLQALENGVSGVDRMAGAFLQVSGISYVYDADQPVGQRVSDVMVGGAPIRKDAVYTLALSNFMYTGGDNYTMFTDAKTKVGAGEARTDFELLAAYASKQKTVDVQSEGRITVKGFADVGDRHWAKEAVRRLASEGIMQGVSEGRFAPNAAVTPAELYEVVTAGMPEAADAVWWTEVGFDRNEKSASVTREQLAAVAARLLEVKTAKPVLSVAGETGFSDEGEINPALKPAVAGLAEYGLLKGRPGRNFAPKEAATRAELSYVLWNIMKE